MIQVAESVAPSHPPRPRLDLGGIQFHGVPATTAHQMVVVRNQVTPPVQRLAAIPPDAVDLSGVSEGAELAVHRRQANLLPGRLQAPVEILRVC